MSQQFDPNPTPKQRLLADPVASRAHNELVGNPQFKQSIELALAEYTRRMTEQSALGAESAYHRIAGAYQFVQTMRNLGFQPVSKPKKDTDNLQPEA